MALAIATMVLSVMALGVFQIERNFILETARRSWLFRAWVFSPAIALGIFIFAVVLAGLGPLGSIASLAAGGLASELWVGLSWYHDRVGRAYLSAARRSLDSYPGSQEGLKRSRLARPIIDYLEREEKSESNQRGVGRHRDH